jgi:hypothetical protein
VIALLAMAWASAQEVQVEGFAELRGSYALGVDGKPWQLIQRVRPEMSASLSERVSLTSTVEASLVEGRWLQEEVQRTFDESDLGPILEEGGCEWPAPPENEWAHVEEVSDWLRVDRLYVDWYQPKFDLRVGRQPLQWGSAMLINPTDPFPEVLFIEPWRFRAGVNAARVTVPIGQRHQVQAVAATDDTFEVGRVAARGTVNALETDFSGVVAYRGDQQDGVIGVDIKGTAVIGFWLEGAYHVREEPYEELAVGVDYSFPVLQTLVVGAQYYRNGSGATDPDDYGVVSRTSQGIEPPICEAPDLQEGLFGSGAGEADPFGPITAGTDYGLVQVALAVNPDLNVALVGFQNLRDGTGIAVPNVSWRPTGALEIGATAQVPYRAWGRTGEFKPAPPDLVLEVPAGPGVELEADLNGLVPEATLVAWTRLEF